jgi:AcrR family transcriptional regulator
VLSTHARRAAKRPRTDFATAILDAARALCFAHGSAGISARKIAARAGCSATTLYLYYRNIDDLLHHLRMEGHALLAGAFSRIDPRRPALERVRAMGRAYYLFGIEQRGYFDLMFGPPPRTAPRRDLVQREMYTLMLLRDVVKSGIDGGEIRADLDVMVATNALWAEIHGITALAVSGMLMQTAAGHDADVLEAILDGAARWLEPAGDGHGHTD